MGGWRIGDVMREGLGLWVKGEERRRRLLIRDGVVMGGGSSGSLYVLRRRMARGGTMGLEGGFLVDDVPSVVGR